MIAEEHKLHFSYEEHTKLTPTEKKANEKLAQLRNQLATPLHNVVLQDFY